MEYWVYSIVLGTDAQLGGQMAQAGGQSIAYVRFFSYLCIVFRIRPQRLLKPLGCATRFYRGFVEVLSRAHVNH